MRKQVKDKIELSVGSDRVLGKDIRHEVNFRPSMLRSGQDTKSGNLILPHLRHDFVSSRKKTGVPYWEGLLTANRAITLLFDRYITTRFYLGRRAGTVGIGGKEGG